MDNFVPQTFHGSAEVQGREASANCSLPQVCVEPTCSGHCVSESGRNCISLMTSTTGAVSPVKLCASRFPVFVGRVSCWVVFLQEPDARACCSSRAKSAMVPRRDLPKNPAFAVLVAASWSPNAPDVEQTVVSAESAFGLRRREAPTSGSEGRCSLARPPPFRVESGRKEIHGRKLSESHISEVSSPASGRQVRRQHVCVVRNS